MKRIIGIVLILTIITGLFIGCGSIKAKDAFRGIESQEGGFSAIFPDKPKRETKTFNTQTEVVNLNIYSTDKDGIYYSISYAQYSDNTIRDSSPDRMLDLARDNAVAFNGKLLKETAITMNNNKGRELKVETENGQKIANVRLFWVKNRLYQVAAEAPTGKEGSKNITKFLDNFKIVYK